MTDDEFGPEATHAEIDRLPGPVLLEFGANWCGYCRALAPHLKTALDDFPQVRFIWIEDGKGQLLGRSFRVKFWPTLVFLKDGRVVEQLARPDPAAVRAGLEAITGGTVTGPTVPDTTG